MVEIEAEVCTRQFPSPGQTVAFYLSDNKKMNLTNPYWSDPPMFQPHKGARRFENNYGFFFKLPVDDIQTAGYYFGENPGYGRRELVMRSDPEYFLPQNIVPASGGLVKYDVKDPIYKFRRSDHTKKF